ncbi:hypothetical protein D9758_015185 [Tetrapyrgos nigripes]|uniref:Aminotransferase class I/classII large domain-containing protein n=1 Tax=Tetrapyrgos nigripes TaxID=182062 RepID=A0A8H5C0R6_9AGAR|nr:hypothetical protein D9758_015185 [Tetrapyrgos nigripes]
MSIASLTTSEKPEPTSSREILPDEVYEQLLSQTSRARKSAPIRHLLHLESCPNMLSMLAGKPNPEVFPYVSLSMTVRSPNPAIDSSLNEIVIKDEDLSVALQYGITSGVPELVKWLTEFTCRIHGCQDDEGWRVSMGAGSQDLLYKAFSALVDPGDAIFVESPTYPGIIPLVHSLKCNIIQIPSDAEGLNPSSMASMLENWPEDKPLPKVLYTVPFGSNPTGTTTTLARRLEILRLARKYNFFIMEDDPYFHIYYGDFPRPSSYFALERKIDGPLGRVLRFDSFSKVLAGGLRLGWVTGPERLIKAIDLHNATSIMCPSVISQMMVYKLLQNWGIEGFLTHATHCADFYRQKRDIFEKYSQKHLTGLAEWITPNASMFVWMKLRLPESASAKTVKTVTEGEGGDSAAFLEHKALEGGVLLLPGECCYIDGKKGCQVRLSFSVLSEEEVDEALGRLAKMLRSKD